MKDNLLARFLVIIGITLLAAWVVWTNPPRLGIDLAGGTSLLFEIDTSKIGEHDDVAQVAANVIDILRKRVDPGNQKNMIWRVVGGKRIQIQMPFPPKRILEARQHRDKALQELQAVAWKRSSITQIALRPRAERVESFAQLAPRDSDAYKELLRFGDTAEKFEAAKKAIAGKPIDQITAIELDAKRSAQVDYENQLDELMKKSVDPQSLTQLLKEAELSKKNDARELLKTLPSQFPLQEKQITNYAKAYLDFVELSGGGVDDPSELQRLVTKAGVLDFRIAVTASEVGGANSPIWLDARENLQKHGPGQAISIGGRRARWFQIDPRGVNNFIPEGGGPSYYVVSEWLTSKYVLCYDDSLGSLTHSDPSRKPWRTTARTPYQDPTKGELVLPFDMDPTGATYMGDLTDNNKGHPMTILLDDKAMSAPNIQSRISDSGVITFGKGGIAKRKEADELKAIMDAGSLPATLYPEPISVQVISPDMGQDNIDAGLLSSKLAVIAVICFMLIYYTLTGSFADLAMLLNLLLVLAAMAMISGTFTLPGIAGLVLTLGMAVDANVLINERIREELHRGASLWMAVKLGYEKVFWTIFDANLTTSLTSIVLIKLGSEEVKGFGITLLIGLTIHMFTALFVTRTFVMAAVKWGIIKRIDDHSVGEYFREIFTFTWLRRGHWPFARVITVSNIDWIGKRYIFWTISGIITLGGIVVFLARGDDKYDIEFRGGTQITMQVKDPNFTREDIVKRNEALAHKNPALAELAAARVYQVGEKAKREFNIETTIAAKGQDEYQKSVRAALSNEFGKELARVTFAEGGLVTFKLAVPEGTPAPTVEALNTRIEKIGNRPGLEDLQGAKVETIGLTEEHEFKIVNIRAGIYRLLLEPLAAEFADVLETTPKLNIRALEVNDPRELEDLGIILPINENTLSRVFERHNVKIDNVPSEDVTAYPGGVAILLDNLSPPQTLEKLTDRIDATRKSPEFGNEPYREFLIIPLTVVGPEGAEIPAKLEGETRLIKRAVLLSALSTVPYDENDDGKIARWRASLSGPEWKIVQAAMSRQDLFKGHTSFDAVVAGQAKWQALWSIIGSLILIIIYVWIRFGGIWYGIGAIVALIHDAVVALACTVLSGWVYTYLFGGHPFLLITDFKVNLTAIAAYLTVIGYSVNDTIVIFDRVRELRGKAHIPITRKLINDAINQCFGRTIWTTFTVFIVLLIMYIWGGEGVRGFCFAMLAGVITGAYSTLAIASPMLLVTGTGGPKTTGQRPENPFLRKDEPPSTPMLPEAAG